MGLWGVAEKKGFGMSPVFCCCCFHPDKLRDSARYQFRSPVKTQRKSDHASIFIYIAQLFFFFLLYNNIERDDEESWA